MLGDERLTAAGDAERCLQVGSDGQHRRTVVPEVDGFGHEAPGTPDVGWCAGDHGHYRVVGAGQDGPVVGDDQVGDAGETALGLGAGDRKWLAGGIGAGGDQCEWLWCSEPCSAAGGTGQGVEQ